MEVSNRNLFLVVDEHFEICSAISCVSLITSFSRNHRLSLPAAFHFEANMMFVDKRASCAKTNYVPDCRSSSQFLAEYAVSPFGWFGPRLVPRSYGPPERTSEGVLVLIL